MTIPMSHPSRGWGRRSPGIPEAAGCEFNQDHLPTKSLPWPHPPEQIGWRGRGLSEGTSGTDQA